MLPRSCFAIRKILLKIRFPTSIVRRWKFRSHPLDELLFTSCAGRPATTCAKELENPALTTLHAHTYTHAHIGTFARTHAQTNSNLLITTFY